DGARSYVSRHLQAARLPAVPRAAHGHVHPTHCIIGTTEPVQLTKRRAKDLRTQAATARRARRTDSPCGAPSPVGGTRATAELPLVEFSAVDGTSVNGLSSSLRPPCHSAREPSGNDERAPQFDSAPEHPRTNSHSA